MASISDRPAIAVVGSLNIDLIAYTARLPSPGETVMGDRFQMGFGGKGANQAVMAARLGASVAMVGALGADVFADMTFDNLARQGVEASRVARVEGSSGVAPIWVEPDGTNRIIVVAGANDRVDPDAAAAAIRSLDRVDVVIGQLEIPQRVTTAAFDAAHQRGATTVLNPAPAATLSGDLLAASKWLIPNEAEFAILAGLERFDPDDDQAILTFADRTPPRLLVTLGARGAVLVSAAGTMERIPAIPVTALDTTGAGDAFVGAFAVGLAAGLGERAAVRLGIACASDSVTRPGTQRSFASPQDAAAILSEIRAET